MGGLFCDTMNWLHSKMDAVEVALNVRIKDMERKEGQKKSTAISYTKDARYEPTVNWEEGTLEVQHFQGTHKQPDEVFTLDLSSIRMFVCDRSTPDRAHRPSNVGPLVDQYSSDKQKIKITYTLLAQTNNQQLVKLMKQQVTQTAHLHYMLDVHPQALH